MRKRRTTLAVALAAVACVFLLLLFFVNTLVDKNRERIREEIEKALGRSVRFDDLSLSFWGGPGLRASRVSLSEDPRFAATPFLQAREAKMQLRWLPLLFGQIAIKSFALEEPEIQIIRNEQGVLNLTALAASERRVREGKREVREPREPRARPTLALLPSAIYVSKGRVDYVDRSFKEPVEVRIRDLKMDLKGLALAGGTKVRLSAGLFEAPGQHLTVEGEIGPLQPGRDWKGQPFDLHARLESLLLAQLTRAIPFLRESPLGHVGNLTGPLSIEARILGTAERPRVSNLSVSGAFGAADNNVSLKGDLDFSKGDSWKQVQIKGSFTVNPTSLEHLKRIPLLKQHLPAALAVEGPLSVAGDLQGGLDDLKARVVIRAAESDLRYGGWLNKPKGIPAEIELKMAREPGRLVFAESSLTLHNLKLHFSGLLEAAAARRLTLRLRSDGFDLSGWDRLLPPLSALSVGGIARWDVTIRKNLGLQDHLETRGSLSLEQFYARDRKSGRGLEKMALRLTLFGKEGRIEGGEGSLNGIRLSNLKGDLMALPRGFGLKNLAFQALGGRARASALWETGPDQSVRLTLEPEIESVDLKQLLAHESPQFKDHIEGRLNLKAKLSAEAKNGAALKDNLQGSGVALVRDGALRDFNLVEKVLSKVAGLPGLPSLISARMPARAAAVLQRRDTPFETLTANFTVKHGRIYSEDLTIVTPDYGIYGDGWVGFDKTLKWDATLAMSPQFTQEMLKQHRNVRYMLDRQGRLSVPFRLEGSLPYVQTKPDLQALAQAIHRGVLQKGLDRALGGDKDDRQKARRDWIQKGLEQLFGK